MSSFLQSKKLEFHVGHCTDIGGARENQDDYFTIIEFAPILIVGVLDGHGREVGKIASSAAKSAIRKFLSDNVDQLISSPSETLIAAHNFAHSSIKEAFREYLIHLGFEVDEVDGYIVKRRGPGPWSCVHGGTSCTLLAIVSGKLYVANVGDSSAMLCSEYPIFDASTRKFVVDAADQSNKERPVQPSSSSKTLIITAEHSPESVEEFHRLRQYRPNENNPLNPALQVLYDSCSSDKTRCTTVFDVSQIPLKPSGRGHYYKNVRREWASLVATPPHARFQDALAFTRSLGDLHLHTYGITHLPEVNMVDLDQLFLKFPGTTNPCICAIIASDGVWDNWIFDDAAQLAFSLLTSHELPLSMQVAQDVATAFLGKNAILAKRNFGPQADNATVIILFITLHPS